MDSQSILSAVTSLATDWFFIAVLFIVIAFDVMRAGPGRSIALALSCVFSAHIFTLIPGAVFAGPLASQLSDGFSRTLVFAAIFAVSYVLIRRLTYSYGDLGGEIFFSLFTALATSAILLATWISTPALAHLWVFGTLFQTVFASTYTLWWIVVGFVILAVSRR